MNLPLIDNLNFKNQNYTIDMLSKGEYSDCTFTNCNFENSNLSNSSFLECVFIDCNLSNTNLMHTTFNDVTFNGCKLVGILFQNCNDFLLAFSFTNCTLNLSSFYQLKINSTKFSNCKMHQVDFTETEVKNTVFSNCDLKDSIFDSTILENADFLTAYNFSINPSSNQMKNAVFSKDNCFGLLSSFNIKIK
nr:pentapeptide repeat-containing protein [Winogradskyella sp.]